MSLALDEARTLKLFARVERIEDIAQAHNLNESQRTELLAVARQAVEESPPVRVSVAARLLSLSERSVRTWAQEGLLTAAETTSTRLLLDPVRLHDVLRVIRRLREVGHDRNLMEAIWHRLTDRALLDREDLRESLAQMHRGEGHLVRG
jgi:hypothetical protein